MLNTTFTTCHPDTLISALAATTAATDDGAEKSIKDLKNIIARRSANGKRFGKLEITAQKSHNESTPVVVDVTETDEERNSKTVHYLTAFVLDISSSMRGTKIIHAKNTIIKFLEVLATEAAEAAATNIKTWFYLITFSDRANVAVSLQEVTEQTIGPMIATINKINVSGSTSYEAAFHCNSNYLRDILNSPTSFVSASASRPPKQLHIVKFFETDGDITSGCSNLATLYQVMHDQPMPHEAYKNTLFTYEDCVFGYGADVDTKCLKTLAAPHPPKFQPMDTSATPDRPVVATHCSSFCSIGKPEDIGWQVGELLFKLITRCGALISVSVSHTDTEGPVVGGRNPHLFEYQTHTWNNQTTLHSIAANETKTVFVQFDGTLQNFDNYIEMTDQMTGRRYKYKFRHEITDTAATSPATTADNQQESDILSMILGMIQIEIFKLMREMEADSTVYDADTLVAETYKMMRILKYIKSGQILAHHQQHHHQQHHQQQEQEQEHQQDAPEPQPQPQPQPMTPEMRWLENLITDAKVLIGLTTIRTKNEQLAIIHARRTSSAEREFFSTGQIAFSAYIEGEEIHEQAAKDAISDYKKKMQERSEGGDDAEYQSYEQEEIENDCVPSRIVTATAASHVHSQYDAIDTPYPGNHHTTHHHHHTTHHHKSILRTLCARIAIAIENNEDITIEQMCQNVFHGGEYIDDNDDYHHHHQHSQGGCNDTFSSIPDDEHSNKRVRMMRQMSTPLSSS